MKRRLIVAIASQICAMLFVLPQLAANTHYLLGGMVDQTTWNPFKALALVMSDGRVLAFYALYCLVLALAIVWAMVASGSIKYKSGMYWVTPDIQIPEPAGQGQFGTAWWLPAKERKSVFRTAAVNKETLEDLLTAGAQDFEEAERSETN